MTTVRIATRASPLALWQAHFVQSALAAADPRNNAEIVEIVTEGDRKLDTPLFAEGGKGLFLKELEQALLADDADIAVHSMKDVPAALPAGLEIAAVCGREDPRDVLVSNRYRALRDIPAGGKIGTCSLRRQCQIKAYRPDLELVNLRGNVHTRLSRLDSGEYHGIILAGAGLIRLSMPERIAQYLEPGICLPAPGQGVIGIECRSDDVRIKTLLQALHDAAAWCRIQAERAANVRLGGGCHAPVALYGEIQGASLTLRGLVGRQDGSDRVFAQASGAADEPIALGHRVADSLLRKGAGEILGQWH